MNIANKIEEALSRGVENVYPNRETLKTSLESGKKLTIYNGIDPTGDLHIGHGVVLLKLRQFQELGHKIILLIGDFTGQVGDPTDKLSARQPLTRSQVKENSKNYKKMVVKILDPKKTEFRHNSIWLDALRFQGVMELASNFTVQRLLERDMFQERIKKGKDIHLHEFLYPVLQAYDSVAMDVDMEIGGSDQTFNMLAGRTLMKKMKGKEKFVLTTKLLEDPSGKKMGKTSGNFISMSSSPEEVFGKVMSWPDEFISIGFEIASSASYERCREVKKEIASGKNPKDLKMELAQNITALYHDADAAKKARNYFQAVFVKRESPKDARTAPVAGKDIVSALVSSGLSASKSDARRLLAQGGVRVDANVVRDEKYVLRKDSVIQKGKRFFVKVA